MTEAKCKPPNHRTIAGKRAWNDKGASWTRFAGHRIGSRCSLLSGLLHYSLSAWCSAALLHGRKSKHCEDSARRRRGGLARTPNGQRAQTQEGRHAECRGQRARGAAASLRTAPRTERLAKGYQFRSCRNVHGLTSWAAPLSRSVSSTRPRCARGFQPSRRSRS